MSDVDCPLLQPHIARCKAGYVSVCIMATVYGHVPDNELDSNELDWTGLVVLFSDMHPRCTCMDSSGGQIPKNEASVRLTRKPTRQNLKLLCDRLEVGSICRLTAQFVDP